MWQASTSQPNKNIVKKQGPEDLLLADLPVLLRYSKKKNFLYARKFISSF